jgi:trehalose 6-phosphate synthase
VAGAVAEALAMPLEVRRERHAALMHDIFENDVNKWQREFIDALRLSACHLAAPLYLEEVT